MSDELDCQACGACCTTRAKHPELYVSLTQYDLHQIRRSKNGPALVVADPLFPEAHLKMVPINAERHHYACAALQGTVGTKVECSIYENRPTVCRTFKPGSADCFDSRWLHERVTGSPISS